MLPVSWGFDKNLLQKKTLQTAVKAGMERLFSYADYEMIAFSRLRLLTP